MKRRTENLIGTSPFLFYFLSFTVGLPMTIIGCLVSLLMLICGYKAKLYKRCICFSCGKHSGFSLGCFIFVNKNSDEKLLEHELGHAIQNCMYGLLMPFIVSIPSFIRYHYRRFYVRRLHRRLTTAYDSIWFEKEATALGKDYAKKI